MSYVSAPRITVEVHAGTCDLGRSRDATNQAHPLPGWRTVLCPTCGIYHVNEQWRRYFLHDDVPALRAAYSNLILELQKVGVTYEVVGDTPTQIREREAHDAEVARIRAMLIDPTKYVDEN